MSLAQAGRAATMVRLSAASGVRREGRPPPVIVKVIGKGIRSKRGLRGCLRYVARLGQDMTEPYDPGEYIPVAERGSEPPIRDAAPMVRDEMGLEVARDQVLDAFSEWDLLDDDENLSRRARELKEANQAWQQLQPAERFRNVQGYHIMLSVPVRDRSELVRFERAVAETLKSTFGMDGHPLFWAVHAEHGGHVHAHVVVASVSETTGRRLNFAPDGELLDGLRERLATEARRLHLDVSATRRVDRAEWLEGLVSGKPIESFDRQWISAKRGGLQRVERAAPEWLRDELPDYLDRLATRTDRKLKGQPGYPGAALFRDARRRGVVASLLRREQPDESGDMLVALLRGRRLFMDAGGKDCTEQAVASFRRMRSEGNPRLAEWYLLRQPLLFGPVSDAVGAHRRPEAVAELRQVLQLEPPVARPIRRAGTRPSVRKRQLEMDDPVMRLILIAESIVALDKLAARAERDAPDDGAVRLMTAKVRERAIEIAAEAEKLGLRRRADLQRGQAAPGDSSGTVATPRARDKERDQDRGR